MARESTIVWPDTHLERNLSFDIAYTIQETEAKESKAISAGLPACGHVRDSSNALSFKS
jgi:hypothetical protein